MASKIIKTELADMDNGTPVYRITAVCDASADVTALGTNYAPGSMAIIPGGTSKMLNASKSWVEV